MLTKRGRPEFTDRTVIKKKAMTIVLMEETEEKLIRIAKKNRRKKAEMARLMIEEMVKKSKCDCN